jgi:hypothetical protein
VGEHDAGIFCGCDCGGHAGDDFEINAGFGKEGRFFGASAEDAGVAAFQADDGFCGGGLFEEEVVDVLLGEMEREPILLGTWIISASADA